MSDSFKGDLGKLGELAAKLRGLGEAIPEAAAAVVPKLQSEIDRAAAAGRDPYGRPFEPLKGSTVARVGGHTPLTGLGEPAKVVATMTGVRASVTRRVPRYHQRGRKASAKHGFMPQRPLVPTNENDPLPANWGRALEEVLEETIGKKLR